MSRQHVYRCILLLFCLGLLSVPALSTHAFAHARVSPHSRKIPQQEIPDPVVNASIQAPGNIWYTGIGNTANNYVLIQYWNGTTFQAPAGIPANSYIPSDGGQAVLSLSPTDSWVIANGHTDEAPLQIFHFDGTTRESFPSPPVKGAAVNAMAAVNAHDIWAVGSAGPLLHSFTMHWDGTSWQAVDTPTSLPVEDTDLLRGVSAKSANDVWAFGTQRDPNGGDSPFVLHWNGKQWCIKSPPDTDDPHSVPDAQDLPAAYYRAGVAVSSENIWAVGTGGVIDHWNGKRWRTIVSPIPSTTFILNAISAYSSHDIWAVGQKTVCSVFGVCNPATFTEHWDGCMWHIVPSPSLSFPDGSSSGALIAVKMFSPHNVWALGSTTGNVFLSHWDGLSWQITAQHNVLV
ncbi:MAG TPA: hypothetical protein VL485_20440 [Ktedonobacteraceae bacterium]|jgi:hypothetical protein|nr:hypothetical protein [Ktedonobacteraceae bacterium]